MCRWPSCTTQRRSGSKRRAAEIITAGVKGFDYDAATKHVDAVLLNDGTRLTADTVISALPFDVLERVADDAMKADDARLQRLGELDVSPIVGLHLWVKSRAASDRGTKFPEGELKYAEGEVKASGGSGGGVMTVPHVVLTGSPIQWVFDQGTDEQGVQHLHGVVSAAHDLADTPNAEILDTAMNELRRFVPGCRDAELVQGKVIKERRATFSCRPGVDDLRPTAAGHDHQPAARRRLDRHRLARHDGRRRPQRIRRRGSVRNIKASGLEAISRIF